MTRSHISRQPDSRQPDWQVHEAQERVARQDALVRRSIVQGAPTQAAEDQLRQLETRARTPARRRAPRQVCFSRTRDFTGEAKRLAALICRSSTDADRMVGLGTWWLMQQSQGLQADIICPIAQVALSETT